MAGAGRKSSYRKSVQDDYMHALPEPDEEQNQLVARVAASRGANIFEVSEAKLMEYAAHHSTIDPPAWRRTIPCASAN
jgi:hypothetical protein